MRILSRVAKAKIAGPQTLRDVGRVRYNLRLQKRECCKLLSTSTRTYLSRAASRAHKEETKSLFP